EYLPVAGHARRNVEPAPQPALDLAVLLGDQRPWPDDAHLAPQDVHELRQLVELKAPDHPAHPRDTRVGGDLEQAVGALVERQQLVLELVGPVDHAAELDQPELLAVPSDPALAEEHRPRRVELD